MKKKKKTKIEKIAKVLRKAGYGIINYELVLDQVINNENVIKLTLYKR